MAIYPLAVAAVESNISGTYAAHPIKSARITDKTLAMSKVGAVGGSAPTNLLGTYGINASWNFYDGTGATSLMKAVMDWMVNSSRAAFTARFLNLPSAAGVDQFIGSFMISSLSNWFSMDANNPSQAKEVSATLVGVGDMTNAAVVTGSTLTPTVTPVASKTGVVKVTSGSLVSLTKVVSASSTMTLPVTPVYIVNQDYPDGGLSASYPSAASVDLTLINDPTAASDYSKMLALFGTTFACEFYNYNATASSGSIKYSGSFTLSKIDGLSPSEFQSSNAKTSTFTLELSGALSVAVI